MSKFKIRESYLLLLIVLGLVSLGIYTTYALFTASTSINDVVGITATLDIGKSLTEYEVITVSSNETKLIELNVVNSYNGNIYYGSWYQIVKGNSSDIDIGLYTEKNSNPGSGLLSASSNINLLVGITNNSTSSITLYIGVKGSLTNELNLGSNKILIPSGFSEALLVTDEVLEKNKTSTSDAIKLEYTTPEKTEITLNPGTYKLEVWGAEGGKATSSASSSDIGLSGGKGGYSYGTLTLDEKTTAYIYVGGKGNSDSSSNAQKRTVSGGFNGGGSLTAFGRYAGGSGAGGSDIRLVTDSLYSRVIVAGGGGGGVSRSYGGGSSTTNGGGYGGGVSGGTGSGGGAGMGSSVPGGSISSGGSTGRSTTKGVFGSGGDVVALGTSGSTSGSNLSGAGGGGWYGGSSGNAGTENISGGGGGSGWVYTEANFNSWQTGNTTDSILWKLDSKYYLSDAATIAGDQSFTDFSGSTVTGHSGDGAIRISGVTQNDVYSIPYLKGLSDLFVPIGTKVDLTDDVTLICENNTLTGCSIIEISITDTSVLSEGTYVAKYTVKGSNNKKYLFNRNIIVGEDTSIIKKGSLGEKILLNNPTVSSRTDFSGSFRSATTGTIYLQASTSSSQMTEDIDNDGIGEKVYYFSGNHKNNWVKFGKYTSDSDTIFDSSTFTSLSLWSANDDIYWKIIRINEDGSIRLLYTGTSTSTKTAYIGNSSPDYLGYMYGSDGSLSNLRLNTNSSSIKSKIDSWYETNLLSGYDKYVSKTAIYCNDRSLESGQKYYSNDEEREFYFSAYKRITSRSIPTYKCGGTSTGGLYESSQAIGDKFSVSKTNGGNGKLTYPVALMTADEIVYAGGVYGGNASDDAMVDPVWYYGNNGSTSWWLMTPEHQYSNGQRYLYYISNETVSNSSGGRTFYRGRLSTSMSESKAIRPVLSLKSCVKYASGDGSSTNPYTVTVDDDCANKEN